MAFINALYNLWPQGDTHIHGLRDAIAKAAPIVFPKWLRITSNLLIAHVMGQGSVECGAGLEVEEDLSYTPARMMVVCRRASQPRLGDPLRPQPAPARQQGLQRPHGQCRQFQRRLYLPRARADQHHRT